jgi:ATP-dependent Clp protease protease subunit
MAEIIALHSGRSVDEVMRDIDRDRFMTAEEAVEYGLLDAVLNGARDRLEPASRPGERVDR